MIHCVTLRLRFRALQVRRDTAWRPSRGRQLMDFPRKTKPGGLEGQARITVCGCFTRRCSMSGWEEELAVLLRELGVKQEEPKPQLRATRKPMRRDIKRPDQ